MKYTAGLLLLTFTLFGCVTVPIDQNLTSQDPEKANKDNIICEKEYSVGSRIPKKICYTAEERKRRSEESKQVLTSVRDKAGAIDPGMAN
jgi:starvation-inducible outer membrane lipoprotein|tara:strand:- start:1137 stop:1406 length:270 start_codon:yes stop_codon:yes gene_type:complete